MIRIFNHYVHGSALRGIAFDQAVLLLIAGVAVVLNVGSFQQALPMAGKEILLLAALLFVASTSSGLYDAAPSSLGRSAARAVVLVILGLTASYAIFGWLPDQGINRLAVQFSVMTGVGALILRRAYLTHSSAGPMRRARILVYGAGPAAQVVGDTLKTSDPNVEIVGYVAGPNERETAVAPELLLTLEDTLHRSAQHLAVDEIIVALTERRSGSMPLRQLLDCKVSGTKVYDLNTHFEKTLGQIRIDFLNASWLIFGDGFNQGAWRTAVKRVFDIVCSALLLVVASPIMLVTAILIKLESPGGIFYSQERVGQNNSTFQVVKFRSMRNDAEKDGRPVWAQANDARVTRVGATSCRRSSTCSRAR
jgi:FlaA1/EpsC-like NDP-sugar epimerase